MKITQIKVTAGRTFNHPHEQYSNLRPEVTLHADLAEDEDPVAASKQLQATAEGLVEDHKNGLLRSLEELYQVGQRREEMIGLQRQLQSAQKRIDEIRANHPALLAISSDEIPET